MPQVLDFDNKRAYFRKELDKMKRSDYNFHGLEVHVTRQNIFQDSFAQLSAKKGNELKGKIRVTFNDEEGLDAGGLLREWYLLLSREIFNENYALFKTNVNGVTFMPSTTSSVNQNHLQYFRFIGKIVAKALFDNEKLDAYFTRSFYKHILGQPLSYHDMEDIDPGYYKNLKWMLENDISSMDFMFSYEEDILGERKMTDLIPNGRNIPVTEENKLDYVREICYAKMAKDIRAQIEAFLEGFHELIPPQLVAIFDSKELELMISGTPDIDSNALSTLISYACVVQDLKENTDYQGYTKDSEVIQWLWEILETFDHQAKASFVQFVTGKTQVPCSPT
jgi:E3 ubiquitin-protein ligase HUWE1